MKIGKLVFALIIMVLFAVALAFSQEEVIKIESRELGDHERPIVQFTHEQHANVLECLRCHHNFDEYNNNTGSEGQACAECHTRRGGENPVNLKDAFHTQCKTCHEQLLSKGAPTGPLMCGECHIRR
jgi:hypothetical protein